MEEALPALEEARIALSDLDKNDVTEIRFEFGIIDYYIHLATTLSTAGHLPSPHSKCKPFVNVSLFYEASRKSTGRLQRE